MSATTLSCIRNDMGEADAKMRNFPLQLWGIASAILGKIHLQKTGETFLKMKNDLSFIINFELNLYEHQASRCPNIPLRDLYYVVAAK